MLTRVEPPERIIPSRLARAQAILAADKSALALALAFAIHSDQLGELDLTDAALLLEAAPPLTSPAEIQSWLARVCTPSAGSPVH